MTSQMDDPQAQGLYKLFIHDLELPCSIGVHAFERNRPQRVRVSLTLWVRREGDDGEDRMGGVVDYEAILEGLRALANGEHIHLLETFAEMIAEFCLRQDKVEALQVRVEKPDIFDDVSNLGIEISRRR